MNKVTERLKMVKAMEFIVRQINDENVVEGWFYNGVADGDIEYGDLNVTPEDADNLYIYTEDDWFSELMGCFLRRMYGAYKSGGLYCGGVCSEEPKNG